MTLTSQYLEWKLLLTPRCGGQGLIHRLKRRWEHVCLASYISMIPQKQASYMLNWLCADPGQQFEWLPRPPTITAVLTAYARLLFYASRNFKYSAWHSHQNLSNESSCSQLCVVARDWFIDWRGGANMCIWLITSACSLRSTIKSLGVASKALVTSTHRSCRTFPWCSFPDPYWQSF